MPNPDVSCNAEYANGDTRRETYHEPDQPDIGAVARASTQFFEEEVVGEAASSTVVIAALQQALRREATTSRRKSTSSQMAKSDGDVGVTAHK